MRDDRPLIEVTTAAASAAARRLTTAAKVQAALGIATGTTLIETYIDQVSADCVRYCKLARASMGAAVPTFGTETLRATWLETCEDRGSKLILPWRAPITAIGSVVEDGVSLAGTAYRLLGGALLERVDSDAPDCWSSGKIVVTYTAGWTLPTDVPAEIEGQVIEQVKMRYLVTERDPSLRSQATQEVGSESYSFAGGDAIGESGLLVSLESALSAFKSWTV